MYIFVIQLANKYKLWNWCGRSDGDFEIKHAVIYTV